MTFYAYIYIDPRTDQPFYAGKVNVDHYASQRGKPRPESVRVKIAAGNRGKKVSLETRMKMGARKLGNQYARNYDKNIRNNLSSGTIVQTLPSDNSCVEAIAADLR